MKKKIIIGISILVGLILIVIAFIYIIKGINIRKYDELIKEIETKAVKWASDNKVAHNTQISIQKLIELGYVKATKNNELLNPIDKSKLNCYLVLIIKDADEYSGDYLDERNCDFILFEQESDEVVLKAYNKDTNKELNLTEDGFEWIKGTVLLKATYSEEYTEAIWYINESEMEGVNTDYFEISADYIMNVKVRVAFIDEENYNSKTAYVRIDNDKPSKPVVKFNNGILDVTSYDAGSGINRYEYSTDNSNWVTIKTTSDNNISQNMDSNIGLLYVRVIDNVGNISDITSNNE